MRSMLRLLITLVGLITLLIGGGMTAARSGVEIPPSAWVVYTVTGSAVGHDGIYAARTSGTWVRQISQNEMGGYSLLWSDDGQWLLFVSSLSRQGEVYRLSFDGKRLQNLTNSPFDETQLSLSPDGKSIAFGLYDGIQAYLAVMPVEGGDVQRLVHTRDYLNEPAWSADGGWIAFTNHTGGEARIYSARADGTDEKPLITANVDGILSRLAWSADNEWIYFSGRLAGRTNAILRMRRDGSEIQSVLNDGNNWGFERLSPDGEWMTAVRYSPSGNGSQLYLMRSDNSDARPLNLKIGPVAGIYEQQSTWSPDGKWIAYAACESGDCGIYLASFDGRTHRRLSAPSPFAPPQYPVWSPPVHTRFRPGIVLLVGVVFVLAGIAPWPGKPGKAGKPHP